ncbi:hypothetical protein GAYE_SCF09G3261 [Galdieria yellowstonensis]|uniref:Gamma-glutamylcyclotransferase AIG2-like domain-containing protein n=1 Tax=Galdieria yellowstonensis TaxID=3028027 RepID=A0AAV9IDF6_9RHOD|nr:hypothetical protein GAYE_SCF09G3261 [Galdieria yellowstonensis]
MFVFVYGTLRKACKESRKMLDFQVPDILEKLGSEKGLARLPGYQMWDLGSYPGIFPVPHKKDCGEHVIVGELYFFEDEVTERVLSVLDEYEGCHPLSALPHEYERVKEPVFSVEQEKYVTSWIYRLTAPPASAGIISCGDYSIFLASKYQ